ncbi:MAG: hypothetical protein SNJ73_02950 [Acetobacteraceae bacterium]
MPAEDIARSTIREGLRNASDDRLRAVVAVVDGHPQRRDIDDLIEAIRPRLAALAVPRPLTVRRALAMPFHGLLTDRPGRARDPFRIPRRVLEPLFRYALPRIDPAALAEADRLARGHTVHDDARAVAVGRCVWRPVAEALEDLRLDPRGVGRSIAAAGLEADVLMECAPRLVPLLRLGESLARCFLPRNGLPLDPTLPTAPHRALLLGSMQRDPALFRLVAAGLLFRGDYPDTIARMIRDAAVKIDLPGGLALIGDVAETLLDDLEEEDAAAPPASAAAWERRSRSALRLVLIVSELEGIARFDALAGRVGRVLGRQFTATVRQTVLGPLQALSDSGGVEPDQLLALEAAARAAKRLEAASRLAGATEAVRQGLAAAREPIGEFLRRATRRQLGGVGPADVARLAEILLGPDEAMALLEAAG